VPSRSTAPRRRLLRRLVTGLLVVAAGLLAVALIAFAPGSWETYARVDLATEEGRRAAPAWTEPCWSKAERKRERLCAHVEGRIVWIQQHDPDGDGDRHLVVVSRLRPRIVKVGLRLGVGALPGIGSRIAATGFLVRGASGQFEVESEVFTPRVQE
jgi:hypothetical protein